MKQVLIPAAFNPAAGTVDFSNVSGFVPARLLAIVNATARAVVYDPTTQGMGIASISGSIVTLQANISAQGASDRVIAFYDDGQSAATAALQPALHADGGALAHVTNFPSSQTTNDGGTPIAGAAMPAGGSGLSGWLSAIWSKLSGTLAVSWSGQSVAATQSGAWSVSVSNLATTQAISAASLPLPAGAATAANQPSLNADGGALAHVTNFPSTQVVSGAVTAYDGGAAITGAAMPTGGSGLTGWLSAIWSKLSGTLAVSWTGQSVAATQSGAWSVSVSNLAATQAISAVSLPLPAGAATAANQPSLNADGGALTHITNFPSTQPVSWSGQTVGVSSLPSLPAGANTIGSVNVANFPSSQTVSDVQSAPFSGAVAMTAGTVYAAQRSLGVLCSSSGSVQIQLSDGSGLTLPVTPGWQTFPFAVVQIVAAGTTATASYFNLK
jgi:Flp pilus assembly pilin Flp